MSTAIKHYASLLFVLILGLSLLMMGCEGETTTDPPTPTPGPTARTLLNNTVSLNGNATCSTGRTFCADHLTFVPPELGKSVTVRATSPSNLDPDVVITNSAGAFIASGYSTNAGLEVVTFTPTQVDVYRVRVQDYSGIGGSVTVKVTQ